MRKPTIWVSNQVRHKPGCTVTEDILARGLKFWIYKVEEMYYPCSENKGDDQLIWAFVFAYADCWFFHVVAQLLLLLIR